MYMMALVCLPCTDFCNSLYTESESLYSVTHQDQQNEFDHCSPLCYCACCSASIILVEFPNLFLKSTFQMDDFGFHVIQVLHEVKTSIWQPPRIS